MSSTYLPFTPLAGRLILLSDQIELTLQFLGLVFLNFQICLGSRLRFPDKLELEGGAFLLFFEDGCGLSLEAVNVHFGYLVCVVRCESVEVGQIGPNDPGLILTQRLGRPSKSSREVI